MLQRYTSERCGDCGRGLTWIEIAFGRISDPVCGACLMAREPAMWAQVRFKKAVAFPNFSMAVGETWAWKVAGNGVDRLNAIKGGADRFEFGGGQCLVSEVELIYVGPNYPRKEYA